MNCRIRSLVLPLGLLLAAGPVRAQASRWTPLGPFGGTVQALTVAPSDAATVYATLGGQGAFATRDAGASWAPILAGTATSNVAVDPAKPGTIYLATDPGGLQKSTDFGGHWTRLPIAVVQVTAVTVDPARPARLYAGTASQGVWRSVDGGASWQPARAPLPSGEASEVAALAVPRTGGVVYAGTAAGVFKSADAGLTWQSANHGLAPATGPIPVLALAVAPSAPKTLYASLNAGIQKKLFRSKDGGASWQATAQPPLPAPQGQVLALAVDPRAAGTVWAATNLGGLFRSVDGGGHWTAASLPESRVNAIALAPSAPARLFAGVAAQGLDLGGVFASANGGASWSRRNQGLDGLDARAVAVPPDVPAVIYAGLVDQGLFRSANQGRRWARVTLPGTPANGIPLQDIEIAPSSPATAYALGFNRLWRTADAGGSWTAAFAFPAGPSLRLLRVDSADPFRLWGGGQLSLSDPANRLLRSADGGETWTALAASPNLECAIFDLEFAPSSPSTLYVAGSKSNDAVNFCKFTKASLFRSTDRGVTWTEADAGIAAPSVTAVAVDPINPQLVYAGTGNEYVFDNGDGVWKSTDGGDSWARAGDALKGRTITALAVSPVIGVVWAATGGAVFRSLDGGATWSDRTDGLQAATVYKLLIDPEDPQRLYAATSGGVWVLADDAP